MKNHRLFLVLTALLLGAVGLRANPVPDEVAREYRELPSRIVAGATEADRARFIELYGRYGFSRGLLHFDDVAFIGEHFGELRDLLAASQAPPYRPDPELQKCYRQWAGEGDLAVMDAALRRWLAEPVTQAPPEGGMIVMSEPYVTQSILDARARAAEYLADDGDHEAVTLLQALLADPNVNGMGSQDHPGIFSVKDRLAFALSRLLDEAPPALVACGDLGEGRIVRPLPAVERARISHRRETRDCPDELLTALCTQLAGQEVTEFPGAMRDWNPHVSISFADGAGLVVSRPQEGWIEVTELGRDRDRRWRLKADGLDAILASLE